MQTDEQREAEIARETGRRVASAIASLPEMVVSAVDQSMGKAAAQNADAMERVLRKMAADPELMSGIATHFQRHYMRTWREWLGGKVWNFILYGVLGATLAWLSVKQLFGQGKS